MLPLTSSAGSCTIRKPCQPTSQQSPATRTISVRSVPSTLRCSRLGATSETMRGPSSTTQNGPSPNMTNGFRKSRYRRRSHHGEARYSSTVRVWMSPTPRRSRSPAVAWWIACSRRHTANGVQTSTPSVAPSIAFVRFDLRNEPCAQSWNTMNVRSRKPAATTENAPASHGETHSATADARSARGRRRPR